LGPAVDRRVLDTEDAQGCPDWTRRREIFRRGGAWTTGQVVDASGGGTKL
jgi:hypothetical protein